MSSINNNKSKKISRRNSRRNILRGVVLNNVTKKNIRPSDKIELTNSPTDRTKEALTMEKLYKTVPKCVETIKRKNKLMEETFKNTLRLSAIPSELVEDLRELKEFIKSMNISTFHSYMLYHNLMNFEKISTNHQPSFDIEAPEMQPILRNNMKLGWLSRLMYLPVEKLVGVN